MQLVIEISEADYEYFKNTSFVEHEDCLRQSPEDRRGTMNLFRLVDAVKDGIVLPKVHGDLIDRDMQDDVIMRLNEDDWQITRGEYKRFDRILFEFPVVIPAEKEGD